MDLSTIFNLRRELEAVIKNEMIGVDVPAVTKNLLISSLQEKCNQVICTHLDPLINEPNPSNLDEEAYILADGNGFTDYATIEAAVESADKKLRERPVKNKAKYLVAKIVGVVQYADTPIEFRGFDAKDRMLVKVLPKRGFSKPPCIHDEDDVDDVDEDYE